jgi:hypothetical protein
MKSIARLAEGLVAAYDLYAVEARVFLLSDTGQLLLINHDRLRGLIDKAFAAVQLVSREGKYVKDFHQLDLSRQDLADLLDEILKLVPLGPSHLETKKLTPGQADEIKQRLQQGEPPDSIAVYFGITIQHVKSLRMAA